MLHSGKGQILPQGENIRMAKTDLKCSKSKEKFRVQPFPWTYEPSVLAFTISNVPSPFGERKAKSIIIEQPKHKTINQNNTENC